MTYFTINKVVPLSLSTDKISKALSFEISIVLRKSFTSLEYFYILKKVVLSFLFLFKMYLVCIYLTKSFIMLVDSSYSGLKIIHFFLFLTILSSLLQLCYYFRIPKVEDSSHSFPLPSKRFFTNSGTPIYIIQTF